MTRKTGTFRTSASQGESVRAFVPFPLPPVDPPLAVEGELAARHSAALESVGRLRVAGAMVPDPEWFLYGFVRKEAVLSSQIEGTQATLRDVATFEATSSAEILQLNGMSGITLLRSRVDAPRASHGDGGSSG